MSAHELRDDGDHAPPAVDPYEYDDGPPTDTIPPTRVDVLRARADERRVVGRAVTAAAKASPLSRRLQKLIDRRNRNWGLLSLGVSVVVSTLVALTVALLAFNNSLDTRDTVEELQAQLAGYNQVLADMDRPTVPAPADPNDIAETITAAATAQVLAALPETPTADDVADQIEASVVASVLGPGRNRLTAEVQAYFAANGEQFRAPPITPAAIDAAVARRLAEVPPPQGEKGDRGERGEPCLPSIPECRGDTGDTGEKGPPGDPACPPPRVLRTYSVLTTEGTQESVLCVAEEAGP